MQNFKMSYGPDKNAGEASRLAMAEALATLSEEGCFMVAGILCTGRMSARSISLKTGLPLSRVTESLSVLCLRGLVRLRFNGVNIAYEFVDPRLADLIVQAELFAEQQVPELPSGCAER